MTCERVPVIPPHRRRQRDLIAHDDPQFSLRRTESVLCLQRHHIGPWFSHRTRDATSVRIQAEAGGKIARRERHGTISRGGDREVYEMTGADSKDLGAVDPGFWRWLRRQDDSLLHRSVECCRGGFHTDKTSVRPNRMVEVDAVIGVTHQQEQCPHALERDIHRKRGIPRVHDGTPIEALPVADDPKDHGALALPGAIIDTHPGHKPPGAAIQLDPQRAAGVGSKAVIEPSTPNGDGNTRDGLVDLRAAISLPHPR